MSSYISDLRIGRFATMGLIFVMDIFIVYIQVPFLGKESNTLQLVTSDGVSWHLPAFTSASSKVRVFVEGRWRTGDNLEEVSIERKK